MKKFGNINATSIIEAMVVMMIIVSGVTGMYNLLFKSYDLTTTVKNKIQAIQIARQGIEAFTNIRDTNWIIFSSDYANCWNVYNYNSLCIGDATMDYDIKNNKDFNIYMNEDNRWVLNENTSIFSPNDYTNTDYLNFYKVGLDNGIYTQTGITQDLKPLYTREIKVTYPTDSNNPDLTITSIVQWSDSTSSQPHKIELDQVLSNWKSKK